MHDHSKISEFNHNGRKDSHGKIVFGMHIAESSKKLT
jgi:hypothetical protein